MKKIILSFILYLLFYSLTAQNIEYYNNIITPSPNVAALNKFGNIPVDYSTGIPKIEIPIYNFNDKNSELSLNISLKYHAGGIKVDEISSSVGIGWVLDVGGAVSRNVQGLPDESSNGYWNRNLPNISSGNSGKSWDLFPFSKIHHYQEDGQIDAFSYSMNGRHGKFMWGKNNDLLILNQEKIIIEKQITKIGIRNMVSKITIIDEKGLKYIFDAIEVTTANNASEERVSSTAWYLTRILSANKKDSITFEYENTTIKYTLGRSESVVRLLSSQPTFNFKDPSMESMSFISQDVNGKRIKKITFPNKTHVSFSYNEKMRTDLMNDFSLTEITVSDENTTKSWKLEQDYSTNRLTLNKVLVSDRQKKVIENYSFDYNGKLPDHLSTKQDHWGYPNNNSGSLIHEYKFTTTDSSGKPSTSSIGTGNRSTDQYAVSLGSLKRIYYPTGGYTDFEMEANQAIDKRLNREWTEIISSKQNSVSVHFSKNKNDTTYFTFTGDDNTYTDFTLNISHSYTSGGMNTPVASIDIYTSSGIYTQRLACSLNPNQTETKGTFSTATFKKNQTYKIVSYLSGCTENCSLYAGLSWKEDISSNPIIKNHTSRELYVGGIRAKRILDYDGKNNIPTLIREYDYTLNGESSGNLGVYPEYISNIEYSFFDPCFIKDEGTDLGIYKDSEKILRVPMKVVSSSTIFSLLGHAGSPVIYKKVKEKLTNNGNSIGFTDYYFKEFGITTIGRYPYVPPINRYWIHGLQDSIKVYNANGELIQKEVNQYKTYTDEYTSNRLDNFKSILVAPTTYKIAGTTPTTGPCPNGPFAADYSTPLFFASNTFYPDEGRTELISKKIEKYEGGRKIENITHYTYNPSNRFVSTEKTTDSKSGDVTTKYFYTQDIVDRGNDTKNIYSGMIKNGMNGILLEKTKEINNKQVDFSRTNYYYDSKIATYLPESHEWGVAKESLSHQIKCTSYTFNGRIQSLTRDSLTHIVYLWSYSGQYPVAEIKNATYTQVNTALASLGLTSVDALSKTSTPNIDKLRELRTKLTDAMVTVYSYQPLVGMLTSTDPQGIITYYNYDTFGRLTETYLMENGVKKVLQGYDYHYSNQ